MSHLKIADNTDSKRREKAENEGEFVDPAIKCLSSHMVIKVLLNLPVAHVECHADCKSNTGYLSYNYVFYNKIQYTSYMFKDVKVP